MIMLAIIESLLVIVSRIAVIRLSFSFGTFCKGSWSPGLQIHQQTWIRSSCVPHFHNIRTLHQSLQLCHWHAILHLAQDVCCRNAKISAPWVSKFEVWSIPHWQPRGSYSFLFLPLCSIRVSMARCFFLDTFPGFWSSSSLSFALERPHQQNWHLWDLTRRNIIKKSFEPIPKPAESFGQLFPARCVFFWAAGLQFTRLRSFASFGAEICYLFALQVQHVEATISLLQHIYRFYSIFELASARCTVFAPAAICMVSFGAFWKLCTSNL